MLPVPAKCDSLETKDNLVEPNDGVIAVKAQSAATPMSEKETPIVVDESTRKKPVHASSDSKMRGRVTDGQATRNDLPRMQSRVLAKFNDTDNPKQLKIISRAGNVTRFGTRLHVLDEETQETQDLDWKEVKEWEELPTEEILISDEYDPNELLAAKFEEIKRWNDYDVYQEIENTGQKAISTRWVNTKKDGVIKARLVARGYEDTELSERVDSPTCEKSNLRLAITIAASNQWQINSLDIQSAFLQGECVEGDIFLKPPKEVKTDCVWKLKKTCIWLETSITKVV